MDGGDNVQRQTNEPSDWAKGFLTPGMEEARTLFKEGPAKHYTEDNGSAIYGFGSQTDQGLNALFNRGMAGAGQRAGAQDALNRFAGGGLGDWGTVDQLRNLGATNDSLRSPAYENLSGMAKHGTGLGADYVARNADILATGGNVGGYSQGAVGDITQSGAGSNAQIRSDINDLITGQAQANNPAFTSLGLTSSGAYLGGSPYLDSMYDRAADRVTRDFRTSTSPAIDGRFAMTSGGSGSGAAQIARDSAARNLGDTLSGLATNIYGGEYGRERDRMLSAASTLGSQYLQGQGLRASTAGQSAAQAAEDARLRLGATGQIAGDMAGDTTRRMQAGQTLLGAQQQDASNLLDANRQLGSAYDAGANRQLSALNSASNAYLQNRGQQLQGLGLMPQFQQMDYNDINQAIQAGGARDALGQRQLDEKVAAFDFGQNAPWNNVQRYLALVGGGSPGTTTSMTGGGANPLAALLSGAGGLGSMAGLLGWRPFG